MEDTLLFKVTTADGHEFKLHTDGKIEGFPDGCWIANYYPFHEIDAMSLARSWPKTSST